MYKNKSIIIIQSETKPSKNSCSYFRRIENQARLCRHLRYPYARAVELDLAPGKRKHFSPFTRPDKATINKGYYANFKVNKLSLS